VEGRSVVQAFWGFSGVLASSVSSVGAVIRGLVVVARGILWRSLLRGYPLIAVVGLGGSGWASLGKGGTCLKGCERGGGELCWLLRKSSSVIWLVGGGAAGRWGRLGGAFVGGMGHGYGGLAGSCSVLGGAE